MSRPAPTIRILGRVWLIGTISAEECIADCAAPIGRANLTTQDIQIRPRTQIEDARSVLLHELIHAVEDTLSLGLTEAQVSGLEAGLYAVLADNAADWTWLDARLRAAGVVE